MNELIINGLSKQYGSKRVINMLSFTFTNGIYGLLGANGAGKTTLMKIICHLSKPDSGKITFNGKLPVKYYKEIGYLSQHFSYYPGFTGLEFMEYISRLKGVKKENCKIESQKLLHEVGLYEVRNKRISSYSGGMKQRLGIAQALINNPKILIFDEPTVGLDPKERIKFKHLISQLGRERIIILSTHIVSDVESIAKEIIVLKSGKIVHHGEKDSLLSILEGKVWEITVTSDHFSDIIDSKQVISERTVDDKTLVRIFSENEPCFESKLCVPNLEDLYLYYFREGK
ncbi:hypothetical protein AT575_06105 [Streptococcus penaeicida]|uniref:ABC transporter domain-containing protein n=1 Tax=Streptococcus penaeicida TaxID=1765960 RepID=A0A2N8LBD8_9STRE|nr:ABC transporter ATP-binding protein [Streptococcus penaeicida]PND47474.1 hypothetical protein AT575_06105 [Streptococcus penaeicida]